MYFKYYLELGELISMKSINIKEYNIDYYNDRLFEKQIKDYIHVLYGEYPDSIITLNITNNITKRKMAIALLNQRKKSIVFCDDKLILLMLDKGTVFNV